MVHRVFVVAAFVALLLAPSRASAEDPPTPADAPPPQAGDAEAREALKAFAEAYKAKGAHGDERTALRELAMRRLAKVQHRDVADALYKLTKKRDADIRTLAVMYLGEQRALPGYAGALVVKALKAHESDPVLVMFAIEAIEQLRYRGAVDVMRGLLGHADDGVKNVAVLYIGDAGEWRMIEDLLRLMKELKIDKGSKTEGHEVRVDTGASGDADQRAAEAQYHARYGNSARKARSGGRAMRDMKPVLLETMKNLTGVDFRGGASARDWADENAETIKKNQKALNEEEAKQKAED